jgi:hypothetical protein
MNIQDHFYKGSQDTDVQLHSCSSDTFMMIIDKEPHSVFNKFTYSDRCKLFVKSLQQKPRHRQEGACSSGKVSCITDRSQPNVHWLYQMRVRHVMWIFGKFPSMEAEIELIKYFDLQVQSLWLLTDRNQIGISCNETVCGVTCEFKPRRAQKYVL